MAGFPLTIEHSGMSLKTTDPKETMAYLPIVTPGATVALAATQADDSTQIGASRKSNASDR